MDDKLRFDNIRQSLYEICENKRVVYDRVLWNTNVYDLRKYIRKGGCLEEYVCYLISKGVIKQYPKHSVSDLPWYYRRYSSTLQALCDTDIGNKFYFNNVKLPIGMHLNVGNKFKSISKAKVICVDDELEDEDTLFV